VVYVVLGIVEFQSAGRKSKQAAAAAAPFRIALPGFEPASLNAGSVVGLRACVTEIDRLSVLRQA
jgi:hypothetical protein